MWPPSCAGLLGSKLNPCPGARRATYPLYSIKVKCMILNVTRLTLLN